jgi:hypothetical protein
MASPLSSRPANTAQASRRISASKVTQVTVPWQDRAVHDPTQTIHSFAGEVALRVHACARRPAAVREVNDVSHLPDGGKLDRAP